MRGWKSNDHKTTVTVYGPHPWTEAELGIPALYSLDYSGKSVMDRGEDNSATNGTRAMGDLGPLQDYAQIPAPSGGRIPVQGSHFPTSNGGMSSPNPVLDLLANSGS